MARKALSRQRQQANCPTTPTDAICRGSNLDFRATHGMLSRTQHWCCKRCSRGCDGRNSRRRRAKAAPQPTRLPPIHGTFRLSPKGCARGRCRIPAVQYYRSWVNRSIRDFPMVSVLPRRGLLLKATGRRRGDEARNRCQVPVASLYLGSRRVANKRATNLRSSPGWRRRRNAEGTRDLRRIVGEREFPVFGLRVLQPLENPLDAVTGFANARHTFSW